MYLLNLLTLLLNIILPRGRQMHVSQTNNNTKKGGQNATSRSRSKSLTNSQVQNKFYFCHYKNSMYMGGMKSFHRNGEGLIIHDNGSSTVCSYYNDFRHGHNITFMENCIMSMVYDKNRLLECMVRFENYLLFLKYGKDGLHEGKGVLIDYAHRAIVHLAYKRGVLVNKKEEKEYATVNRVFDLDNLQFLIGVTHAKVLKFDFDQKQNISCIKSGNKITIGFCKRALVNGLGFTFSLKDPQTSRNFSSLYLKPVQRGYFQNSQLAGMGEKWFKNGNYYIGDFKDGIFQGRGILKNSEKNNWVLGCFCKGNMVQLIEYSHEGDASKFGKLVEIMHERKSSWINKQVIAQNPELFLKEIEKILTNKPLAQMKTLEQRKQEVLRKIQDNFICEDAKADSPIYEHSLTPPPKNSQHLEDNSRKYESSAFSSPQRQSNRNEPIINSQPKQTQLRSVYKIKLLEVPNTSDTGKHPRQASASPSPHRHDNKDGNRLGLSQKSMGFSQIKDQSPSFKLDSKRMIGRSRLFKYTDREEEEPPRFSFTPKR